MVSLTGAQVPLSGAQYDIAAGDYQATVTELGAGLRLLRHHGQPVITEYETDVLPPAGSGQLLCPWPNRVDHGRYSIGGVHVPAGPVRAGQPERDPRADPVGELGGGPARGPRGERCGMCCSATRATRSAWNWRPATGWPPSRPGGQHQRPERRLGRRAVRHRVTSLPDHGRGHASTAASCRCPPGCGCRTASAASRPGRPGT